MLLSRGAVQSCPEEVEESEAGVAATSAEERQRQLEARHENIRLITGKCPFQLYRAEHRVYFAISNSNSTDAKPSDFFISVL